MASSKVLASSNSRNSDRSRHPSSASSFPKSDCTNSGSTPRLGSAMTLEGLLRETYTSCSTTTESTLVDASITLIDAPAVATVDPQVNQSDNANVVSSEVGGVAKTVEEVWREIVSGDRKEVAMKEEVGDEMMTLEDFLARNVGMEDEEETTPEVKVQPERLSGGLYTFDPMPQSPFQMLDKVEGSIVAVGNGVEVMATACSGRGKRGRNVLMEPLDKAAQQRQRRMIKNRESAARSRERKQAYQVALESMAVKLEEENEQLLKERDERNKARLKQLMENVIPVVEQRRPRPALRRVRSLQW